MTLMFTADPQIQHAWTAQLRGFDSVAAHDEHVADMWCTRVHKRDLVWVLGDTHLGSVDSAMEFYRRLPGRKRLVLGNHDMAHPMHRKAPSMLGRYQSAFEYVADAARISVAGYQMVASHFPYDGDSRIDVPDRCVQWRLRDLGQPLLHGHVHSPNRVTVSALGTTQVHVGWDAWGGPVADTALAQLLDGVPL